MWTALEQRQSMPVLGLEPWVQHVAYSLYHLPIAAIFLILINSLSLGFIQSVLKVSLTENVVTFWVETAVFTTVTSRNWQ